jgi:hypothetical protein
MDVHMVKLAIFSVFTRCHQTDGGIARREPVSMKPDEVLIRVAISSWEQVVTHIGALCLSLTEEQLLVEVAPAKNRLLDRCGHLTATHDAMFSVLRLRERLSRGTPSR